MPLLHCCGDWEFACHIWSEFYLSLNRGDIPTLNLVEAGTQFVNNKGMKWRVNLRMCGCASCWSKNSAVVGFEPNTISFKVEQNHQYTSGRRVHVVSVCLWFLFITHSPLLTVKLCSSDDPVLIILKMIRMLSRSQSSIHNISPRKLDPWGQIYERSYDDLTTTLMKIIRSFQAPVTLFSIAWYRKLRIIFVIKLR